MVSLLTALLLAAPSQSTAPEKFCQDTCENPDTLGQRHQKLAEAASRCSTACEKEHPNPDKSVVFITDACRACIDKCDAKLARDEEALSAEVEACNQSCKAKVDRHSKECCATVDGYTGCDEACLRAKIQA